MAACLAAWMISCFAGGWDILRKGSLNGRQLGACLAWCASLLEQDDAQVLGVGLVFLLVWWADSDNFG